MNYCKLVIPGAKFVHAIRELWVSMPTLLIPFENSSEIHFTIKSPIETGKWGDWAGQWEGGKGGCTYLWTVSSGWSTHAQRSKNGISTKPSHNTASAYTSKTSSKLTKKLFFDFIDSPFSSQLSKLHSCSSFFPSHLETCNPTSLQNAAPRSMNI